MSYWVLQCKRCGVEIRQEWGCPLVPGWAMRNQEHACPHCIHEENKLEESFEEMRKEFWDGK